MKCPATPSTSRPEPSSSKPSSSSAAERGCRPGSPAAVVTVRTVPPNTSQAGGGAPPPGRVGGGGRGPANPHQGGGRAPGAIGCPAEPPAADEAAIDEDRI